MKRYRLIGGDGREYQSESPGTLGAKSDRDRRTGTGKCAGGRCGCGPVATEMSGDLRSV